jgi:hypothetical protein
MSVLKDIVAQVTPSHISATMIQDIVAQQWEPVTVGTHCCSTMTSDHISATMTYVMWWEGHFWNVRVLQRVHFPILLILYLIVAARFKAEILTSRTVRLDSSPARGMDVCPRFFSVVLFGVGRSLVSG